MKLIFVVVVILVFQTKLSFLSVIGDQIQEQDDEYENDNSSNDMVESSKGFRNIDTSPNKGWTWSNPSVDLWPICKTCQCESGSFIRINPASCCDGYHIYLKRLACVGGVVGKYENRVQSMAKDFHIHQNKWKRLQTSVLQYQRRLKQMKQALFRSRQG